MAGRSIYRLSRRVLLAKRGRVCDIMASRHLAVGGLSEGLRVGIQGLVVIVRCWKMYCVHKSPHKAGSVSVFLYMRHSEVREMHLQGQY